MIVVNDFVLQHYEKFPELENYLGFVGTEGDDVAMDLGDDEGKGESIY